MPTPRLYPFALPGDFHGGLAHDGRQVLLVDNGDDFYALWFDKDGRYLQWERHVIPPSPERDRTKPSERTWAASVEESNRRFHWLESFFGVWMRERGVTPGMIHVQRFSVPDAPIVMSLVPYPRWMEQVLEEEAEPLAPGEEVSPEWERKRQQVREWEANGGFVLLWNASEYWLDGSGKITST